MRTLTIELTPEAEYAVQEVEARGIHIESWVDNLLASIHRTPTIPSNEPASLDEWEQALDALSDDIDPTIPPLPDAALTRESFYAERTL